MKNLITRVGNHEIVNEGDFKYVIKKDESKGMMVPVTIYADEKLVSKMALDRTIDQAANVATLKGVMKHVVVLPDGHEGYGFPVGGVARSEERRVGKECRVRWTTLHCRIKEYKLRCVTVVTMLTSA